MFLLGSPYNVAWFLLAYLTFCGHGESTVNLGGSQEIPSKNSVNSNGTVRSVFPNILLILADDLGFGDLQMFSGHPTSHTPNLNKLILNSKYLTNFYTASPVCSPSRAALLTGFYPVSTGIYPGVFWPNSEGGLDPSTPTLARLLSDAAGYTTTHIGKWHLGVGVGGKYLPTNHGFQDYFGIPYSHDMCPCDVCFPNGGKCLSKQCQESEVSCPLFDGSKIGEQPTDLTKLTDKYTQAAVKAIKRAAREGDKPFFLYMAYHQTHHPQFSGPRFHNTTSRGSFGDSLAEMDDSIGQIISALAKNHVLNNTIIIFTSDNGPSLTRHERGGCAGALRCGKGTTWEGGMRVPAFVHWEGHINPGFSSAIASVLDIVPSVIGMVSSAAKDNKTFAKIADKLAQMDGFDLSPVLLDQENNADGSRQGHRRHLLYFPTNPNQQFGAYALRYENYKAHFYTEGSGLSDDSNYDHDCRSSNTLQAHDPPILYDLDQDPGERYPLDPSEHAELLADMTGLKKNFEAQIMWAKSQMRKTGRDAVPCCNRSGPSCEPFPSCCNC